MEVSAPRPRALAKPGLSSGEGAFCRRYTPPPGPFDPSFLSPVRSNFTGTSQVFATGVTDDSKSYLCVLRVLCSERFSLVANC
jgi:hypothetical protein